MRVLAITAHPDDMEFMCAGTLLKCKARGDEVFVCTINKKLMETSKFCLVIIKCILYICVKFH